MQTVYLKVEQIFGNWEVEYKVYTETGNFSLHCIDCSSIM